MIIVGAKGLAKEVLQIIEDNHQISDLLFFDDVNKNDSHSVYNTYSILRSDQEVKDHFVTDNQFALGLGNPRLRQKLCARFEKLGGKLISVVDKTISIGNYTEIYEGCTLMAGVKLSNGAKLGKGVLVYYDVIITHDVQIGDFVELSPGCKILGRGVVGDFVNVGAGAIILPDLKIGKSSVIGAGAVVTKDVPENSVVVGNPAKQI